MRTLKRGCENLKFTLLISALFIVAVTARAELTPRDRNILAKEAQAVNRAEVLITDNSWNKLPGYKARTFWESLSATIRQEYISRAEGYVDYSWPVVKATDYLEFIRSGDRRQGVYSACSNALISHK